VVSMPDINIKKVDDKLNLYKSFDMGNSGSEDKEKNKQLEDNITKSFLVTLDNLTPRQILDYPLIN